MKELLYQALQYTNQFLLYMPVIYGKTFCFEGLHSPSRIKKRPKVGIYSSSFVKSVSQVTSLQRYRKKNVNKCYFAFELTRTCRNILICCRRLG